jgi:hypothetical protein
MSEIRIVGTYLTGQIGSRTFSGSLRKNPSNLTLASGSYRVARAEHNVVWGDIVLLMPSRGSAYAGTEIDFTEHFSLNATGRSQGGGQSALGIPLENTLVSVKSPRDAASGQAAGIAGVAGVMITSRSLAGIPSLVMHSGLADLVAALSNSTDVTVQIS